MFQYHFNCAYRNYIRRTEEAHFSTFQFIIPVLKRSAHLSCRILQDQRVQSYGAEHARLPRARLGLYDQI